MPCQLFFIYRFGTVICCRQRKKHIMCRWPLAPCKVCSLLLSYLPESLWCMRFAKRIKDWPRPHCPVRLFHDSVGLIHPGSLDSAYMSIFYFILFYDEYIQWQIICSKYLFYECIQWFIIILLQSQNKSISIEFVLSFCFKFDRVYRKRAIVFYILKQNIL